VGSCLGRRDSAGGSTYTASDVVAREIHARLRDHHLLLLTDFDGTLADLAPTPDEAALSETVRAEIDALAALRSVTFGVVSGRRLTDVSRRVGSAPEFVAGLHGLEITGPGTAFHHYALESVGAVIGSLMFAAARQLAWCPGLLLEDKTYALTCHVRLSPPDLGERALEEFEALAEPLLEARVLKLLTGAKAMELLPAVDWHKGRACEWIRGRVRVTTDRRADWRGGTAPHAPDRLAAGRTRVGRASLRATRQTAGRRRHPLADSRRGRDFFVSRICGTLFPR
jgi:trehalose-phosphatase